MKWLIPVIILLSGCAGKEIVVEPEEVKISIPVPCVEREDVPKPVPQASEYVTIDSAPGQKISAVLVERKRLRAQNDTLFALLESCVK